MTTLHVNASKHYVDKGLVIAEGDAVVEASRNATVILFAEATCNAEDDADVTAKGNNKVRLHGFGGAHADVTGTSTVTASGKTHFTARGQARAIALGDSQGFVLEQASLSARGRSTVTMLSSGELVVTEQAMVLYAPLGQGVLMHVTAAGMEKLADELRTIHEGIKPATARALDLSVLPWMEARLRVGLASRVMEAVTARALVLARQADLIEVLARHGFWRA